MPPGPPRATGVGRPSRLSAACTVRPVAARAPSRGRITVYVNSTRTGDSTRPVVSIVELIVVATGVHVLARRFDDGQEDACRLQVAIRAAQRAQQIGPANLEPDEVVGVVDHPHLVGLGVSHAHVRARCRRGAGQCRLGHRAACDHRDVTLVRGSAAARSARTAAAGSGAPKTADPATNDRGTGERQPADVGLVDAAVELDTRRRARPLDERAHRCRL